MIDPYRALTGVPAGARPPKLTVTDIEWCRDLVTGRRGYSWNFVDGCEWASPGCDNCYAKDIATRFAGGPVFPNGFDLTLHVERLAAPLYQRRGARIFVNSMSDVGLSGIPVDLLARAFAVMALAHWHTFLIASKRPGVLRSRLSRPDFVAAVRAHVAAVDPDHAVQWPLPNVHVGVSVEDQAHAWRVLELLHVPAAVHWVSAEPLIGPLNLRAVRRRRDNLLVDCLAGEVRDPTGAEVVAALPAALRWVVIGGESGHRRGVRPMHPAWVDTILADCAALDVAAFFKQWGVHGLTPAGTGAADSARDRRTTRLVALDGRWCTGVEWARAATHPTKVSDAVRELWNDHHGADSTTQVRPMYRVGRQEAGRLVRGQLVEAYPEARHG
ncbi:DUF5131 family protein [Micromonospora sp. NPDC049662]|uniref:DUF5131 family protein n=1 Tax=Micromonospora sp. NPDC049662 TaxID=3155397 RepID=UPI00342AF894